jgi:hypothetical protein
MRKTQQTITGRRREGRSLKTTIQFSAVALSRGQTEFPSFFFPSFLSTFIPSAAAIRSHCSAAAIIQSWPVLLLLRQKKIGKTFSWASQSFMPRKVSPESAKSVATVLLKIIYIFHNVPS